MARDDGTRDGAHRGGRHAAHDGANATHHEPRAETEDAPHHEPVLVAETLEHLAPARGGVFVDCTLGLGGHAEAILAGSDDVRLVGIDRDPAALEHTRVRLARFGERVRLVEGDFHRLADLPGVPGPGGAAGVLADLGVSSLQLDRPERGFSFRAEGPLDMRMGGVGMTAENIVNTYPEDELVRIFREYGDERQARRIARAVVEAREEEPLTTTTRLAELIHRVKKPERRPRRGGRTGRTVDPATQVFQALRIEVNKELEGLEQALDAMVAMLELEGRLVVISYHSGEDRIVKNKLRDLARGEKDPVTGRTLAETQLIEVLTKKPVRPSEREVAANPRSRSGRLRAARRIR